MNERDLDQRKLLQPRPQVTAGELALMPASMTAAEGQPWTRLSRSAYYKWLRDSGLACRLGHSIRIPTRRFLSELGVLDEERQ